MYKHKLLYIVSFLCLLCTLSAQQSKTSKSYHQRLKEAMQAEEEQQVISEQKRQQEKRRIQQTQSAPGSINKSARNSSSYSSESRRAIQLDEVNNAGYDASDAISAGSELQKLLSETETIELPPLSVFLNAAYENATIKYQEAAIDEKRADYIMTKRSWLNYFRINGSYSYGVFSALTNSSNVETPLFQAWSGSAQHTYNIGAGVSISIGELVNTKQKMNMQKAIMRQAQYQYDNAVETRKLTILNAYNAVVEQLATIRAKAEAAAMYEAQMKISENEFINGRMSLETLSLERARRTGALVTFQECKIQLHNAITLLELLTNIKILNSTKHQQK